MFAPNDDAYTCPICGQDPCVMDDDLTEDDLIDWPEFDTDTDPGDENDAG